MDYQTNIPKDYQPVTKTIPGTHITHPACGYETDGHAEAACDTYRLHYEHDPIRESWRTLPDKPTDYETEYRVDKPLFDWLKVAGKCAKVGNIPVRLEPDGLRVAHQWADFGEADALFMRPLPVPEDWRTQYAVVPKFLTEALQYVTRGKPCQITVSLHGPMIAFHNCTRHAYVMPKRIGN